MDAGTSLASGLGQSLLPQYWNTREPSNVNDSDLYPAMGKVEETSGPSEMAFCEISHRIAKFHVECTITSPLVLQNGAATKLSPCLQPLAMEKNIENLDAELAARIQSFNDPTLGPVHDFAGGLPLMSVERLREQAHFAAEVNEHTSKHETTQYKLFRTILALAETPLKFYDQAYRTGLFSWFVKLQFQVDWLLLIAVQLCQRVRGQEVETSWSVLGRYYGYHELYELAVETNRTLASQVLKA
ncbi:hypothetical protein F4820DRAFT_40872 [Hypoxylon rubiginosum]|uniref:Uncharacterized protein n=1 Tax=Hypoxylon rubiginosum TaxID=110542 RepID=A0ACB9YR97_9PEZI|nr:hypothetical protein F4820DRAFT_40872 [Hypoxylon rubiginosum]